MADERRPGLGYRSQEPGEYPGRFEVEAQQWHDHPKQIVQVVGGAGTDTGSYLIEAQKPDARVALRLTIGFRAENGGEDRLDYTPDGRSVRSHLADSLVWVALCDAFGSGMREAGDFLGTQAAPVQLIADGHWARILDVRADCKAVRAYLSLASSGIQGRWVAIAKWTSVAPMSDRDWMHARERMQLVVPVSTTPLSVRAL